MEKSIKSRLNHILQDLEFCEEDLQTAHGLAKSDDDKEAIWEAVEHVRSAVDSLNLTLK